MFGLDDFAIYLLVTAGSQAVMSLTAPEEKEVPKSAQDKHYDKLVKMWKDIKERSALRTEIAKFINPDFKPSDESSRARIDEEEAIFAEYDFSFMDQYAGGKKEEKIYEIESGRPRDVLSFNIAGGERQEFISHVPDDKDKQEQFKTPEGREKFEKDKQKRSLSTKHIPSESERLAEPREFSISDIKDIKGLFSEEEEEKT